MKVSKLRPVAQLIAVVAMAVGVIAAIGLPAVEWADVLGWLRRHPPELVAAAVVQLAMLVTAWWVLASTTLYLAARALRLPRAVGAIEWVTLPAVRRMADRAAAVSLMGSTVVGGAVGPAVAVESSDPPPTPAAAETVEVDGPLEPALPPPSVGDPLAAAGDGGGGQQPAAASGNEPSDAAGDTDQDRDSNRDRDGDGDPGARRSQGEPDARSEALAPPSPDGPDPADKLDDDLAVAGERYRVQPGDHLWAIAKQALSDAWGRAPSVEEVDGYWRELIAANRDRLTSGDPDLIYPGEHLVVPDVHADPDPSKG